LLGLLEHPRQFGRHVDLAGARPLDPRQLVELGVDRLQRRLRIAPSGPNEVGAQPLGVLQEHLEQMLRGQPLMAAPQRHRLRRLQKPLGAIGVFLELHDPNLVSA
jgi:hypothetical protein